MAFQYRSYFYHYKEKFMDFYERDLMGGVEALLFSGILGFLWIMFALDLYLNLRQRQILQESENPTEQVLLLMNPENFIQSRNYSLHKNSYNLYYSCHSMIQTTIILMTNILPWLWEFSAKSILPWTIEKSYLPITEDLTEEQEIKASQLFLTYVVIFNFIDELPWKIYNNFYLENKYQFDKISKTYFIFDQIKNFIISLCLIFPFSFCVQYIIKSSGSKFYLQAWGLVFVTRILLMFIYPELIAPIFGNYQPLPDGQLKIQIEDLAESINFPLTEIFVAQESKSFVHNNVYFYGFGKNKKLVLFDSILRNYGHFDTNDMNILNIGDMSEDQRNVFTNDEILAILSHEFGHWKLNHKTQNLIICQINLFLMFYTFGNLFNYGILFKTCGFKEVGTPNLIKLTLIFQFLFPPYNALIEFVMILCSRQNEFQADLFSTNLGYGTKLIDYLIKLQYNYMLFPIYDKWYSMFNQSNPPLLDRIKAIKENDVNK